MHAPTLPLCALPANEKKVRIRNLRASIANEFQQRNARPMFLGTLEERKRIARACIRTMIANLRILSAGEIKTGPGAANRPGYCSR